MALFDFLKKKKKSLPLPPPPAPPEGMRGDLEPIRSKPAPAQPVFPPAEPSPAPFPELPEFPAEEPEPLPQELPVWTPPPQPKPVAEPFHPPEPKFESPNLEIHEREEPAPKHAVPPKSFIALDDYKKILSEANSIRSHLLNADGHVKKLAELKTEEERHLHRWHDQIEKLEKKLTYVDDLISKAKR